MKTRMPFLAWFIRLADFIQLAEMLFAFGVILPQNALLGAFWNVLAVGNSQTQIMFAVGFELRTRFVVFTSGTQHSLEVCPIECKQNFSAATPSSKARQRITGPSSSVGRFL